MYRQAFWVKPNQLLSESNVNLSAEIKCVLKELLARKLAKWLDYLILCNLRKKYRIAEIWARELYTTKNYVQNELVHYGMLGTDVVHLNEYGNRGMTSAIMKPLLHMWAGANPKTL